MSRKDRKTKRDKKLDVATAASADAQTNDSNSRADHKLQLRAQQIELVLSALKTLSISEKSNA